MLRFSFVLASSAMLLNACGGNNAATPDFKAPDPTGTTPSAILDLSHWALTLPVDADGGTGGTAKTVRTPELVGGYQSDWFYGSKDGADGVTFWAPVNGALTPSSRYPRSELREMLDPSDPSVNWTSTDTATMTARVAVNQTPLSNGRVVVGKILGYNGSDSDISYLAHLVYQYDRGAADGTIFALVEHSPQGGGNSADRFNLVPHQALNEPFDYSIGVAGGAITITVDGHSASTPIDPQWNGTGLYFRAGAGLQARGSDATDGARVTIESLHVEH